MLTAFTWFWIKALIRLKFPTIDAIDTATLAHWLADPHRSRPVLLDTRTLAEYRISHLEQAQRIDPHATTFEELTHLPADTPIVTYCSVGYRSAAIAQRLQSAGFTKVTNLEGSLFQWANEGRPLYCKEQGVCQVHGYNRRWSQLLRPCLRATIEENQPG